MNSSTLAGLKKSSEHKTFSCLPLRYGLNCMLNIWPDYRFQAPSLLCRALTVGQTNRFDCVHDVD
jgi:hypothetical protein